MTNLQVIVTVTSGTIFNSQRQVHMCDRVDRLPLFPYNRGWETQPNSRGLYTHYKYSSIPIKGGMTIPNIATFDHGTYHVFVTYQVCVFLGDVFGGLKHVTPQIGYVRSCVLVGKASPSRQARTVLATTLGSIFITLPPTIIISI